VALQSLKDLGRLTYRMFLKLFRHLVGMYDLELSRRLSIITSPLPAATLRMRTEMVLETLVSSSFNHLTRLVSREAFIIFGTTPRMSDQPVSRPLPTQDSTTQKNEDRHPCLERDSNPRSVYPSDQGPRPPDRAATNWL
jgi:hypothetical protein